MRARGALSGLGRPRAPQWAANAPFPAHNRPSALSPLLPHPALGGSVVSLMALSSTQHRLYSRTTPLSSDYNHVRTQIQGLLEQVKQRRISAAEIERQLTHIALEAQKADMNEQMKQDVEPTATAGEVASTAAGTHDNPLKVSEVFRGPSKWIRIFAMFSMVITAYILYHSDNSIGSSGVYEEYDVPENAQEDSSTNFLDSLWRRIMGKMETQQKPVLPSVTFADVRGCEGAKAELQDIVDYLKNPRKYEKLGVELPKGVLVTGPPGCGKTLLARALAGEAGVPFIQANGTAFTQVLVGLGAARVRQLFKRAKELAPCIIFIDEIDALAAKRNEPMSKGRATLNQLLVEMDGFAKRNDIIIMGATNLPKLLDPAVLRPGRFDRVVNVSLPNKGVREEIIKLYLKDKGEEGLNLMKVAESCIGFSGAELKSMVNIALIEAVKDGRKKVTFADLADAKDTVAMGRARKSMVIDPTVRRIVAYHEAGHALMSLYTTGSNPIFQATLVPRGSALGMVQSTPASELLQTKESMLARLDMAMGGRAAEELIFGSNLITQGASDDFRQAYGIARDMVTKLGMGAKTGICHYQDTTGLSSVIKARIDDDVKALMEASAERAKKVLLQHQTELHSLATALLEKETLTMEEISEVIKYSKEQAKAPSSSKGAFVAIQSS